MERHREQRLISDLRNHDIVHLLYLLELLDRRLPVRRRVPYLIVAAVNVINVAAAVDLEDGEEDDEVVEGVLVAFADHAFDRQAGGHQVRDHEHELLQDVVQVYFAGWLLHWTPSGIFFSEFTQFVILFNSQLVNAFEVVGGGLS